MGGRRTLGLVGSALFALVVARRLPSFRPFVLLLSLLARLPPGARSTAQKWLFKIQYDILSRGMKGVDSSFLNYGYAPADEGADLLELSSERERDRYSMQLYDKVAGAIDLRGLDVLEVGCGRGGGAALVFDHLAPASVTGLDLSDVAVAHCRRVYARTGLRFVAGDAERLPFPDASFDAVLNVESSHCYPDIERFLAEVVRVLRPGGALLFADFRSSSLAGVDHESAVTDVDVLREQIASAGLVVVEEEDITANVVHALKLNSPRVRAVIERRAPMVRSQLLEFAGVEGTRIHRALEAHEVTYLRMVLRAARDCSEPAGTGAVPTVANRVS